MKYKEIKEVIKRLEKKKVGIYLQGKTYDMVDLTTVANTLMDMKLKEDKERGEKNGELQQHRGIQKA